MFCFISILAAVCLSVFCVSSCLCSVSLSLAVPWVDLRFVIVVFPGNGTTQSEAIH